MGARYLRAEPVERFLDEHQLSVKGLAEKLGWREVPLAMSLRQHQTVPSYVLDQLREVTGLDDDALFYPADFVRGGAR